MSDHSAETIAEAVAVYATYGAGEASRQYPVTPRTIVRWANRLGVRSGWTPPPKQIHAHGTCASYRSAECRCIDCRTANAAYHRAMRSGHKWKKCDCVPCFYARLSATTGITAQDYYTDPDARPKSRNGESLHAKAAKKATPVAVKTRAEDPWGLPFVDSRRPDWSANAACHGKTDLFFTDVGEPGRRLNREQLRQVHAHKAEAQALCAGCPVRTECLRYALENHERFDIWGGLTARQRRGLTPADLDRKVSA